MASKGLGSGQHAADMAADLARLHAAQACREWATHCQASMMGSMPLIL